MAKVIRCQCGFLGHGETVEEAATVIEAHMRAGSSRAGRQGHPAGPDRDGRRGIGRPAPGSAAARKGGSAEWDRTLPEATCPMGRWSTGDWLQDQPLTIRGCGCSTSAGGTRARRCRTPSAPSTRPAHIPGAVFVDWEHDFIDADDPVPVQIADADAFAARAGELGVGDGDLVVTYDDYYGIFAARVAWAFRYYGAESRVLDGGWTTWMEKGGRSASRDGRRRRGGSSRRVPGRGCAARWPRSRTRATRGATLVDARPRHLFLGEPGAANTGHIPGSRCLPYQELVDGATGLWAAPAAVSGWPATPGSIRTDRRAS